MDSARALRNVESWMSGRPCPPQSMEIAITRRCNLRCIFCDGRLDNPSDEVELPFSEFMRLIKEAGEMGVEEIALAGGGEPFFRPKNAISAMRAIKEHGMNGSVTTNGLFPESVVEEIVEMGWDNLIVSLDGPDPASHDFMRNRAGLFNRTVGTLEHFQSCKERLGMSAPAIHINMILSNRTHTKITGMFQLAHKLGIPRVNILPLLDHVPGSHVARMSAQQMEEFLEHAPLAREVGRQLGIESNIDSLKDGILVEKQMRTDEVILADAGRAQRGGKHEPIRGAAKDPTHIPCYYPWLHLVIHSSGHVKPCIQEEPVSFVNGRPLREIWKRDAHLEDIRHHMLEGKLYRMCSSCCAPVVGKNREIRELARSKGKCKRASSRGR